MGAIHGGGEMIGVVRGERVPSLGWGIEIELTSGGEFGVSPFELHLYSVHG